MGHVNTLLSLCESMRQPLRTLSQAALVVVLLAEFIIAQNPNANRNPNRPQPNDFASPQQFEQMMRNFAEPFVPGMFGELTPEQMSELERIPVSAKEESQYGNQVLNDYEVSLKSRDLGLIRRGTEVDYLQALVQTIRPLMTNAKRYNRIDVVLTEGDDIDAYSIPGGHLVFTGGLLRDVQSEAELIGVVAHELSHLDRGHQLLPLKQSKSLGKPMDFRSGMNWMATFLKPFRPEFESQADADAVRWMIAAGYDPRELANLLERWSQQQDKRMPWQRMIPSFVRSHPDAALRARKVLELANDSKADLNKLFVGKQNLKQRIPAQQRKLPD